MGVDRKIISEKKKRFKGVFWECKGNVLEASRRLEIAYSTAHRWCKEMDLDPMGRVNYSARREREAKNSYRGIPFSPIKKSGGRIYLQAMKNKKYIASAKDLKTLKMRIDKHLDGDKE